MGLLDDPSKLLKPADVGQQWNTGAPYQGMPRAAPGMQPVTPYMPAPPQGMQPVPAYRPPPVGSPGMQPIPNYQAPPGGMPPIDRYKGAGTDADDPRQTILALFKKFGLT